MALLCDFRVLGSWLYRSYGFCVEKFAPRYNHCLRMEISRIADLLRPFLGGKELPGQQLNSISMYIDLLLRWNARINLTSIRQPEAIVTRHFGESLFAARHLFPAPEADASLLDLGSGAGFPAMPTKLWAPEIRVTLIESNHKKVAFLRQLTRSLGLSGIGVFADRVAAYAGPLGDVVTLRAIEHFSSALPVAARLVTPGGRLALFIGEEQVSVAAQALPSVSWPAPIPLPLSERRVLLIGNLKLQESATLTVEQGKRE